MRDLFIEGLILGGASVKIYAVGIWVTKLIEFAYSCFVLFRISG